MVHLQICPALLLKGSEIAFTTLHSSHRKMWGKRARVLFTDHKHTPEHCCLRVSLCVTFPSCGVERSREPASSRYVMRNHIKIHFGTGQGQRAWLALCFVAAVHLLPFILSFSFCSCSFVRRPAPPAPLPPNHHHHNHLFPPPPLLVTSKGMVRRLQACFHQQARAVMRSGSRVFPPQQAHSAPPATAAGLKVHWRAP